MDLQFNKKASSKKIKIPGWIPAAISILVTCFWAFWGIIENFHEGWYLPTLLGNLGLMFAQYLSPMMIFMALTTIGVYRPKIGAIVCAVMALFSVWFFRGGNPATTVLIASMILVFSILFWFAEFQNRQIYLQITVGLPLLTLLIAGISPAIRVSGRKTDLDYSSQLINGNGIELIWAPAGPGWPVSGENWQDAQVICNRLGEDGQQFDEGEPGIWRLPTVDEAVRSMMRHGINSGGVWKSDSRNAFYEIQPDKEAPLWDTMSPIIYWWTATEIDDHSAWMIEYDGQVWPRKKTNTQTYLGFRCVRDP